jgi:hypothetical protein
MAQPTNPLANLEARLDWAWHYIENLKAERTDFLANPLIGTLTETDPQSGDDVRRLRISPPIPPRISFIAGDAIHNLRSTLDNLVWHIALRNGQLRPQPSQPYQRTQFPICLTPSVWKSSQTKEVVKDLPSGAVTEIEKLQPYQVPTPERHKLWILNRLWNDDKHRAPHVAMAMPSSSAVQIVEGNLDDLEITYNWRPLNDGDEVVRIHKKPGAQVTYKAVISFEIVFGEGPASGLALIEALIDLHRFVEKEVLPPLARFL